MQRRDPPSGHSAVNEGNESVHLESMSTPCNSRIVLPQSLPVLGSGSRSESPTGVTCYPPGQLMRRCVQTVGPVFLYGHFPTSYVP